MKLFSKETYQHRRNRLKSDMESGLLLFVGNTEAPFNYPDNTYSFRQDSTFLYLFGIDRPDIAGIIDIDNNTEMLFGNDATMDDIIWMGPQPTLREQAEMVGVTSVQPMDKLDIAVQQAMARGQKVHFVPPYRAETVIRIAALTGIRPAEVAASASRRLIDAMIALRSVKEPCEIDELEQHMAVGYAMHTVAMTMAQDGATECEIRARLEAISLAGGGAVSFPTICSIHGETLHNHHYRNTLRTGDLLLVDAGSESPLHYATDHTRTTPVGGTFSTRQREIYQIVLDANNVACQASRPGVFYRDVHFAAARTIAQGLKDLGLMKGDVDEAVRAGAHALFFPHGIGHMLGLDVHDMENYNDTLVGYDAEIERSSQFGLAALRLGRRLKPGFVVTDEPGIYFIPALIDKWKSEKLFADFICYDKVDAYRDFGGIRLEDDLLITHDGARILGSRIPIEPDEVETTVREI